MPLGQRESPDDTASVPDKATVLEQIAALKACRLSRVSPQKVAIALSRNFKILPFVLRQFLKVQQILRARLNVSDEVFMSERDISYRWDVNNIRTYGRASMPMQTMFYGTVIMSTPIDALNTILFETSAMFNEMHQSVPSEFVFTLGHWTVVDDLRTSEIVFSKRFIETIPYVRDVYTKYIEGYREELGDDCVEAVTNILSFYADEFPKTNIRDDTDDILSATYSQLLIDYQGVEAILYPSARVDNHGMNIAVPPFLVEKKLRLDRVVMGKAVMRGKKRIMIPLRYANQLGPLGSSFQWEDAEEDAEITSLMHEWLAAD
jgi:hypothetical protein